MDELAQAEDMAYYRAGPCCYSSKSYRTSGVAQTSVAERARVTNRFIMIRGAIGIEVDGPRHRIARRVEIGIDERALSLHDLGHGEGSHARSTFLKKMSIILGDVTPRCVQYGKAIGCLLLTERMDHELR